MGMKTRAISRMACGSLEAGGASAWGTKSRIRHCLSRLRGFVIVLTSRR